MRGLVLRIAAIFAALVMAGLSAPASASPGGDFVVIGANCSSKGSAELNLGDLIDSAPAWTCPGNYDDLSGERVVMRLKLASLTNEAPQYLISRINKISNINILVADRDGATRQLNYAMDDLQPAFFDGQFSARLPEITPDSSFIYIAVTNPTQATIFNELRLEVALPGTAPAERNLLFLLACLCGLVMTPLIFNAVFYRVLKEQFVLWHTALVICTLTQILATSGLYTSFLPIGVADLRVLMILSFGGMAACGIMFAAHFIEKEFLSKKARSWMIASAIWVATLSVFHAISFDFLGRYSANIYYIGVGPVVPSIAYILFRVYRDGSRAVLFQIAGWSVLMLVCIVRVGSQILLGVSAVDANILLYVGIVVEVMATALGVADRFLVIRLDRDRAEAKALLLEDVSERDPLTNLMNRRMLDRRFDELRAEGFNTIALIDLDRFKQINDRFGHKAGDTALIATAAALRSEPGRDVVTVRMGGEEFLLLARGVDARERLERIRCAIPIRIAHDLPGLDRTVTASMGIIEIQADGIDEATLDDLYKRADMLLYEAKQSGRNRTMHERLTLFPKQRVQNGHSEAAA